MIRTPTVLGFTGTRRGMTPAQAGVVQALIADRSNIELHHGCCVGADEQAATFARSHGLYVVAHPPILARWRSATAPADARVPALGYLARDRAIVAASDLLLAAPDGPERDRSGTWYTIRRARETGTPHMIVWPDGRTELHDDPAKEDAR